ncbi:MAG: asparagine synthase (glutamine-hydrolyzing) [Syntrophobacteraceae bacterium]
MKEGHTANLTDLENRLQDMVRAIAHRGPDQTGIYVNGCVGLGFARLSIIDLSAAGNQPMCDESKQYWITFNGEVFNYRELKRELETSGYRFISTSDTEVVLKSYMRWGLKCFEHFRGMWGLVIYDARERVVVASRDYYGIKPLYFGAFRSDILYWSSEIKAFAHATDRLEEDSSTALDYIQFGLLDHSEATFFKNVSQLRPGHIAVVDCKLNVARHKYWDLNEAIRANNIDVSETEQIDTFKSILCNSIDISTRSDVPIWILLSGGLDSSAIAATSHYLYPDKQINAITVVHDDVMINEYEYAEIMARHCNIHLDVIRINTESWSDTLFTQIYHQDEPTLSATAVNHWFLMKRLHEMGIKAIMSGQGIDEVLYGYVKKLMGYFFADLFREGRLIYLLEEIVWHAKYSSLTATSKIEFILQMFKGFWGQGFVKSFKSNFISRSSSLIDRSNIPGNSGDRDFRPAKLDSANLLHNAFFHLLSAESIPAILHYEDRNSMAFGVEERVPFLDREIVSYLFALPSSAKVRKGVSKWIFREALRGILPDQIRTRISKLSFTAPEASWVSSEKFQAFVKDTRLLYRLKGSIVDVAYFEKKMANVMSGKDEYDSQIWRIYNYAVWKSVFNL